MVGKIQISKLLNSHLAHIIEDLTEIGILSNFNPPLKSYKENNPDMDLAMVIMDFKNSEVYARVKLLGDTELKVPTQFVLQVIFNEIIALFVQFNQHVTTDCH